MHEVKKNRHSDDKCLYKQITTTMMQQEEEEEQQQQSTPRATSTAGVGSYRRKNKKARLSPPSSPEWPSCDYNDNVTAIDVDLFDLPVEITTDIIHRLENKNDVLVLRAVCRALRKTVHLAFDRDIDNSGDNSGGEKWRMHPVADYYRRGALFGPRSARDFVERSDEWVDAFIHFLRDKTCNREYLQICFHFGGLGDSSKVPLYGKMKLRTAQFGSDFSIFPRGESTISADSGNALVLTPHLEEMSLAVKWKASLPIRYARIEGPWSKSVKSSSFSYDSKLCDKAEQNTKAWVARKLKERTSTEPSPPLGSEWMDVQAIRSVAPHLSWTLDAPWPCISEMEYFYSSSSSSSCPIEDRRVCEVWRSTERFTDISAEERR